MNASKRPGAGSSPTAPQHEHWLDRPKSHDRIALLLAVACFALVVVDFTYDQHGHFAYEEWNGFHALFGFSAYVAIVQTAKVLRWFVKRPEDYYGE